MKTPEIIRRIGRFWAGLIRQQRGFTTLQLAIGTVTALAVAGGVTATVTAGGTDLANELETQIHTTVANITGTYMVRSSIYGQAAEEGPRGKLAQLVFTVSLVTGGGAVDFTPPQASAENNGLAAEGSGNKIVVSYTDDRQHVVDLYWTVEAIGQDDGNYLLEDGEQFQITIGSTAAGKDGGNLVDALADPLTTSTHFSIEMGGAEGATLAFDRTTPSYLKKLTNFR
jgi:hypothetical protein